MGYGEIRTRRACRPAPVMRTAARASRHGSYAAVYVLTNYDTTHEYDLYRVYTLRDMGYDPYVMVYD